MHCYLCGCGSCRGVNGKACARCCTAYVKRGYPSYKVQSINQQQQKLNDDYMLSAHHQANNYPAADEGGSDNLYNMQQPPFEEASNPMMMEYRHPFIGNLHWSALSLPEKDVEQSLMKILTLRTDIE
uniref:CXXC-type domain-containing protein n=1 Tax=Syphacia muris TaxID=451379 RepID=A0A0N5ARP0_9BILA